MRAATRLVTFMMAMFYMLVASAGAQLSALGQANSRRRRLSRALLAVNRNAVTR